MDGKHDPTLRELKAMAMLSRLSQDGMVWMSDPGGVDAWVQAVATLAGISPEAIMGMSIDSAMGLMRAAVEDYMRRVQHMAQKAQMDELVRQALGEGME